ncbi:hypothetical protein [Pseudomonas aeruginosa]|uniref:hypothetical protein n=1 Tax=Pseudomonas aeruginosa TaxID=287 RepID=UPI0032B35270|nr:hypothetical protein [Pseudomonas aeruginosa]HCH7782533.1 hypothetical protein [Pseudomonas aeruginosa]
MNDTKEVFPVVLGAPIAVILVGILDYMSTGKLSVGIVLLCLALMIFCWGGVWWLTRARRAAIANRVFIDIHPNLISVSDGTEFRANFSSAARFISNIDRFRKSVEATAERRLSEGRRFAFKESAHIRLHPSPSISRSELTEIEAILEEVFLNPEIELGGGSGDSRTAYQA